MPGAVERRRARAAGTRPRARASGRGRRAPGRSVCAAAASLPAVLPSAAAIAFDVEDVVDDLEGEADVARRRRRSRRSAPSSPPAMTAPLTAEARISAPVLRACMRAQAVGVEGERVPRRLAGGLQVDRLAADHAGGAGGLADDARCTRSLRAADVGIVRRRLARQQRERLGLQAVAGEDRDAVAVDDVQRRPSAPQRVVVHRRQIVVDERVGVDQLERAGGRQRRVARRGGAADRVRDRVGGGERRASAAAACRRRTGCSASPRRRAPGRPAATADSARARRRRARGRGRGTRRANRLAHGVNRARNRRRRATPAPASARRAR